MRGFAFCLWIIAMSVACGLPSPSSKSDIGDGQAAFKIAPPPEGLYLGIAERDVGDMYTFEHALNRRAPLFWPEPVLVESREGVIDAELNFDPVEAQKAWDNGYLVMFSLEPRPDNGMRVDDLLRGRYDEHLLRVAGQLKQFGKPMFFATAREPNIVLQAWKGGYGPDGDKSMFWALENNVSATASFNPSSFPSPQLYEGLGDPNMDDGLERLAAAQRYYHDFFIRRQGLDFLTFETMGYAISGSAWDDGEVPPELQVDFVTFYKMLGDTADWVSLNFYTLLEQDPSQAVTQNLAAFDAQIQDLRKAGIDKPILITELGLCGTDTQRGAIVEKVLEKIVADYPEVGGIQLWNISAAHESMADRPCTLNEAVGFPELRKVIDNKPSAFHCCPRLSDGTRMPTCAAAPSDALPKAGCFDRCLSQGTAERQCLTDCKEQPER